MRSIELLFRCWRSDSLGVIPGRPKSGGCLPISST